MRHQVLTSVLMAAGAVTLAAIPSNVDPAHKFSWSENVGWMNWRDANSTGDGVVVGNDFLSGSIWAENAGWINVGDGAGPYGNTTGLDFGVNVLTSGDLDGFAWGENLGWVNFGWAAAANPDRPRLDSAAGRFRGWAWSENAGWINLDDATHFVAFCPASSTPVTPTVVDEVTLGAGQNTATTGGSIKNRYISVQGGDPGRNQVLRVRVVNLPAPYDVWNGMDFWVDSIQEVCENSGDPGGPPCPPAPGLPKKSYWQATLTCDVNNALKRHWTTLDLPIHIVNEVIVPSRFGVKEAVYEVAFADESCSLTDDASYSDPLVVTQPRWGDVVENCTKNPCGAPEGVVNVPTDIIGVLSKFTNRPGAPIKSRADLVGTPPTQGELDHKITIVDVLEALGAFVGEEYDFTPGDPCDGR